MKSADQLVAKAKVPAERAMRLHPFYRGKIQVLPKCPIRDLGDFAIWYTPGVAAPCRAIHKNADFVFDHTNKGNTVAVVSDGTRVLGLGDIGPEAGLPVMEGKALLFKYLGGVDAVPLCLNTKDPEEIVRTVKILEPSFGGINLEDISQPKCFTVLDRLRAQMSIPVWHDDQQGTATVVVAGLLNALKLVGKSLGTIRTAMIGMGAANVATYRLLTFAGLDPAGVIACDSHGILHTGRPDAEDLQRNSPEKWKICKETNPDAITGGIREAMRGADVCIAFSQPGPEIIRPEWIRDMGERAVVFACANPIPELWPWDATAAGAVIVSTGRSDFPNQVNNSLGFPGIFRGVLDVRARTITDEMAMAAARELAACAEDEGLTAEAILPRMDDWEVFVRVAIATAMQAQNEGVARLSLTREDLEDAARYAITSAREATHALMRERLIAPPPSEAAEKVRSSVTA
jgi:malate dehydrogenase (oxaloacetate-decarboxylating)